MTLLKTWLLAMSKEAAAAALSRSSLFSVSWDSRGRCFPEDPSP